MLITLIGINQLKKDKISMYGGEFVPRRKSKRLCTVLMYQVPKR